MLLAHFLFSFFRARNFCVRQIARLNKIYDKPFSFLLHIASQLPASIIISEINIKYYIN